VRDKTSLSQTFLRTDHRFEISFLMLSLCYASIGLLAACAITINIAPLEEECGAYCPALLKFVMLFSPICMCWGGSNIYHAISEKPFRFLAVQNMRCDVPMSQMNPNATFSTIYMGHHPSASASAETTKQMKIV
jgi:hypothetical protein